MRSIIKKILKESENELGWVDEIIKQEPIKVGDVFYVVDTNISMDAHPLDYKPENVRYLFFVTDIYEGSDSFELEYRNCDPEDISYDPKDYNPTNPRCHYDDGDGYYTDIEYKDALNLIDQKYWRPMGNNGYYNHLTESEEEFGWIEADEPFHKILMKDKFRKPQLLDEIYTIMFNPPVSVGDDRFNKIAYFLEDNEYYPEVLEPYGKKTSYIKILKRPTFPIGNNGRYEIGPELNEQELYELSQTVNPKNTWNGNFWEDEFIARFFKKR